MSVYVLMIKHFGSAVYKRCKFMWMDEYALNQNNVAKVLHLHLSVALLSVTHV